MKLIQAKGLRPGDEYADIYSARSETEHVTAVRRYCAGGPQGGAWIEVDTLTADALTYTLGELVVVV